MLWDAATGEAVRTFKGHQDGVNAVAFSPNGRFALSGSDDMTLMLWDVADGKDLCHLTVVAAVNAIDWRRDKVVIGLDNGEVEFFRARLPGGELADRPSLEEEPT